MPQGLGYRQAEDLGSILRYKKDKLKIDRRYLFGLRQIQKNKVRQNLWIDKISNSYTFFDTTISIYNFPHAHTNQNSYFVILYQKNGFKHGF